MEKVPILMCVILSNLQAVLTYTSMVRTNRFTIETIEFIQDVVDKSESLASLVFYLRIKRIIVVHSLELSVFVFGMTGSFWVRNHFIYQKKKQKAKQNKKRMEHSDVNRKFSEIVVEPTNHSSINYVKYS